MSAPDKDVETQSNDSKFCVYDFGPEEYDDVPEEDALCFVQNLEQLGHGLPIEIEPLSLQPERKLVFTYTETYVQGSIKEQGVEPLGVRWYDCLNSEYVKNLKELFGPMAHISPGQDWMHTMIIEDYPGIIHCYDRVVEESMIIAACGRLVSLKTTSNGERSVFNEHELELNLNDQELSSKAPCSIIICRSEEEAYSVSRFVERLLPAGISWDLANESLIDKMPENQHKFPSLVVGTVHYLVVYLNKFHINTVNVESLYLIGSEMYSRGSKKANSLLEVISYIREQRKEPISSFLTTSTAVPLSSACWHLLSDNYSVVVAPKKTNKILPDVKICLNNPDDPQCSFFKKLAWLKALIGKITNDKTKANKSTIIVCEKQETCNFIATFLTTQFETKILLITRDIHPLEFERTKNLFYARESDFLVMDYHALRFLDSGDFPKIIAFNPPKPTEFPRKMGTMLRLSQRVAKDKVIYLILDPLADRELIVPVHTLLGQIGSRVSTTFHALYLSLYDF